MKTFALFILLSGLAFISRAQSYAVINDKDGFVNVREGKNATSRVVGKIYKDAIFNYEEEAGSDWVHVLEFDGNWVEDICIGVEFSRSKIQIHQKIQSFKDSCIVANDSFKVVVRSAAFDAKRHKLAAYDGKTVKDIRKIDGKRFWGTDGEIPRRKITYVSIIKNNLLITVPKNAFDDLYEPNNNNLTVYFATDHIVYIQMNNSDGAGSYTIFWVIKDGKYMRRFIDTSYD